ncbi:MAG TPA: vitamin K epoxide reductase family protein [Chloroflexia bacterium]|nr:vitamin K epoxide reductase family protein [Chloroflexia bacterium]
MQHEDILPESKRNPSRWSKRLVVLALAIAGLVVASYLALYQLGLFSTVWEPFFGNGSVQVLHSSVSRWLPVPDAALGALAYLTDIVLDSIGGHTRWRTMPWVVLLLGLAAVVFGLTSLVLIILQATVFHAFCTLCLTSAFISFVIAGLVIEEVSASLKYLNRRHKAGVSLWSALRGAQEERIPPADRNANKNPGGLVGE